MDSFIEAINSAIELLPPNLKEALAEIWVIFSSLWWFWFFLILFYLASQVWLAYRQFLYKKKIRWALFELRIPRENKRPPRSMEQVLMAIYSLMNAPANPKEKWWDGEVTLWFSAEVISFGGEIHFYIRAPSSRKGVVEAALYGQYQDIEIMEVDDYIDQMPPVTSEIDKMGYNFFGSELRLAKLAGYPIRTYMDFETNIEEKELDPISSLLEIMAKLDRREVVWVQILFRGVTDKWKKQGEVELRRLKEKFGRQQIETQTGKIVWTQASPGELELLKLMDKNLGKPGFESLIRYIYFAPKKIYADTFPRRGIFGSFNQYASESTNKFAHNFRVWTRADFWNRPHVFWKTRLKARKRRILDAYRHRRLFPETWMEVLLQAHYFFAPGFKARKMGYMVLNAEALATIFHLPTSVVMTQPFIKRSESRKIGPPAGLPIFGGGEKHNLPGIE